jgi:hypothetical protein
LNISHGLERFVHAMANESKGLPKSFVFPNDANKYLNSRSHIKLNTSLNLLFEFDMVS